MKGLFMITYLSYITAFIENNRIKEFKSISFINPTAPLINIEISLALIPVDFVKRFLLHDGYREVSTEHSDICKVWEHPARLTDDSESIFFKNLFDICQSLTKVSKFPDVEVSKITVDHKGVIVLFFSNNFPENDQVELLERLGFLGMLIDNPNCEILLDNESDEG
jgi:hypothetical protein